MASARDYECPICMMLMIEPVMLPCKHELCYKCFMLSYTNTSDQCPFCRVRIATWARRAIRYNRVVNKKKWDLIKRLFPEKVKCVVEGNDVISDEEETGMQVISEDGSLGKEYMAELEKAESERLRANQEEEAASLALIEKLFQAEGQPFTMPSGKTDSASESLHFPAAVKPSDRTYSITDEDRLKQIEEEEAASLRLIQQLQEEEEQMMREHQKREELDREYARMIASDLNKSLPTDSVIDPSDCVVIYPSSPCSSFTSVFCVDASSPASPASANILPGTPSTSCAELPSSGEHMSTEAADKVMTPNSVLLKSEMNVKGKKPATTTSLTKWLKSSRLPEAALGSSSESATTSMIDPVFTNPPTQTKTSREELPNPLLFCSVVRPSVTGSTSQQDDFSAASAAVAQSDSANSEQLQTFVQPGIASTVSEEIVQDVLAYQVDHYFGVGAVESVRELSEPHSAVTSDSNAIENHNDRASPFSDQPSETSANNNTTTRCFSHNSDLLPRVSGSQSKEPTQVGDKHGATIAAICNATGIVNNTPTSKSRSQISVISGRGRKILRKRRSAVERPATQSLKRSIVYLDDPEQCCSTSSASPTTCHSILPDSSCCPPEKRICLNWSEASTSTPKISKDSEAFEDTPLTRSDFNSEASYQLYLEERDYQLALHLQRKFDLELKPKSVHRSDESAR